MDTIMNSSSLFKLYGTPLDVYKGSKPYWYIPIVEAVRSKGKDELPS
jgi:hypothetical protein